MVAQLRVDLATRFWLWVLEYALFSLDSRDTETKSTLFGDLC